MIELKNVSLSLGGQKIIPSMNHTFSEGKTHVLIGSSGCGKSTLLRLILGILKPHTGQIRVSGKTVSAKSQRKIVNQIGYVVQDGGLYPHLTVRENIGLVPKLNGVSRDKIESKIDELVELVHVKPKILDKYPNQISGGQKQRVSLMRSLIRNPKILLLDEPLGALDPIVRAKLQTDLKTIFESLNKTVVLVTHDIGEAAYFGHTVSLMKKGEIVQSGPFQDLVRSPKSEFVTKFLKAQKPNPYLSEIV